MTLRHYPQLKDLTHLANGEYSSDANGSYHDPNFADTRIPVFQLKGCKPPVSSHCWEMIWNVYLYVSSNNSVPEGLTSPSPHPICWISNHIHLSCSLCQVRFHGLCRLLIIWSALIMDCNINYEILHVKETSFCYAKTAIIYYWMHSAASLLTTHYRNKNVYAHGINQPN